MDNTQKGYNAKNSTKLFDFLKKNNIVLNTGILVEDCGTLEGSGWGSTEIVKLVGIHSEGALVNTDLCVKNEENVEEALIELCDTMYSVKISLVDYDVEEGTVHYHAHFTRGEDTLKDYTVTVKEFLDTVGKEDIYHINADDIVYFHILKALDVTKIEYEI